MGYTFYFSSGFSIFFQMFILLGMYNFGLYSKVNFIHLLPPLKLWNQQREKNKGLIWHCDLALNVK